jgi:ubiquinone/menaquinone biosynthesis C-methylase UbiE
MSTTSAKKSRKGYRGLAMEGLIARWYARNTASHLADYRKAARWVADELPEGGEVLEVAPGPGYLAIELARLGPYRVVGLDISHSFVCMARGNALKAGVTAAFEEGDAAAMPFPVGSFDFVVCRAAFKNFSQPVQALTEMHRVLRPGGKALILDLRPDASPQAIADEVKKMGLGPINSLLTKWIFKHSLVKRAYSQQQFRDMASQTPFHACKIREDPLGLAVSLVTGSCPGQATYETPSAD